MNKLFPALCDRPEVFHLIIFLSMIFPAIILFFAAGASSLLIMGSLLGVVILANLLIVIW